MADAQKGYRDVYKYFHFEPFEFWWNTTVADEIFEENLEQTLSRLDFLKQKTILNAAAIAQGLVGGILFASSGDPVQAAPAASGFATFLGAWRGAAKEENRAEFTAKKVDFNRVALRKNLAGYHIDKDDMLKFMEANPESMLNIGSGFRNTSAVWDKSFKGLTYKLVPEAVGIFEQMKLIEEDKFDELRTKAKKANMELDEFRRTTEGVRIEDKHSSVQLGCYNRLLKKYLQAAMFENKRVVNNLRHPDIKEDAVEKSKALYHAFDLLFRSSQEYMGTSTWNPEENLIKGEQAFSHTRFCFDLDKECVFTKIKGRTNDCEVKYKENLAKNGYLEIVDEDLNETNAVLNREYLQALQAERKQLKQEVSDFKRSKYDTVRAYREGMFKIAELEYDRTGKNGYFDERIIKKIHNEIDKMVTACEAGGFEEEARKIRLAQFGASKVSVNIKGPWVELEDHFGEEYDKAMEAQAAAPKKGMIGRIKGAVGRIKAMIP